MSKHDQYECVSRPLLIFLSLLLFFARWPWNIQIKFEIIYGEYIHTHILIQSLWNETKMRHLLFQIYWNQYMFDINVIPMYASIWLFWTILVYMCQTETENTPYFICIFVFAPTANVLPCSAYTQKSAFFVCVYVLLTTLFLHKHNKPHNICYDKQLLWLSSNTLYLIYWRIDSGKICRIFNHIAFEWFR